MKITARGFPISLECYDMGLDIELTKHRLYGTKVNVTEVEKSHTAEDDIEVIWPNPCSVKQFKIKRIYNR